MATRSTRFGVGRRESHDSSPFYGRALKEVETTSDRAPSQEVVRSGLYAHSAKTMVEIPDDCVALMVTSPPYHVGKEYDSDLSFDDYLGLFRAVFKETYRCSNRVAGRL